MAACPVCHSQVEITSQHYGTLYNCPSCNAVFFVDWNGLPEEPSAEEELLTPTVDESFQQASADFPIEEPTQTYQDNSETEFQSELPAAYASNEEHPPENYNFDQPLGQIPDPTEPVGGPAEPSNSFSDITDFGNSDVTQAAFNYSVIISGIDSASIYAQVKEALTDSKFGWNINQVMSQAKDGVLTIRSVNAVKASILIQRVKYLPVKISWRQDVLSSSN